MCQSSVSYIYSVRFTNPHLMHHEIFQFDLSTKTKKKEKKKKITRIEYFPFHDWPNAQQPCMYIDCEAHRTRIWCVIQFKSVIRPDSSVFYSYTINQIVSSFSSQCSFFFFFLFPQHFFFLLFPRRCSFHFHCINKEIVACRI